MLINAAARFRCRHQYVAVVEHKRPLLVCTWCDHRTEALPLRQGDRGALLRFPVRGDAVRTFAVGSRARSANAPLPLVSRASAERRSR